MSFKKDKSLVVRCGKFCRKRSFPAVTSESSIPSSITGPELIPGKFLLLTLEKGQSISEARTG